MHRTVHILYRPSFPFLFCVNFLSLSTAKEKNTHTQKCDGFWHCPLLTARTVTLLFNVLSITIDFFFFFFFFISFYVFSLSSSIFALSCLLQTDNYYIMTLMAQPARILNEQSIDGMGNILRENLKLKTMQQGIEG